MPSATPHATPSHRILVIGAGIGGLTAAALLAHRGHSVIVFDQAIVPGGCASTFKRRGFTFDVGATQVAGLEPGGIHHRIFTELKIDLPEATACDPACAVFLPGETQPINIWRDPEKWQGEWRQQFPGSEPFWQLMKTLFESSWRFQQRDPILPPGNLWDFWQLIKAVRPDTLITMPFTLMTVADVLRLCQLDQDIRLKTFLDLQLKLYSQVDTEETALLYAATALAMSQAPQGLYHLQGSMQVLSDRLVAALERDGGTLLMQHTVEQIEVHENQAVAVQIRNQKTGEVWQEGGDHIIANVTVQNLVKLLATEDESNSSQRVSMAPNFLPLPPLSLPDYKQRINQLPSPSGAFVVYLGVDASAIPHYCPPHLQFLYDYGGPIGENNSLFVSVSHTGDGRAPLGQATITASSFTDTRQWWNCQDYLALKQQYTEDAIKKLGQYFQLTSDTLIYQEAATPRTFARYTGRDQGVVGGIGQRIPTFGPFGFANRTPIRGLWLVGDSTHPGEGTAGVSYSALTVVRQIAAEF